MTDIRQPAGQPTGGQYAAHHRTEADVTLSTDTDPKTLADAKVGDTVILIRHRQENREVPVVNVGRTLITVEVVNTTHQFRILSGAQNSRYYGTPDLIRTRTEITELERRSELLDRLYEHGIGSKHGGRGFHYDNDTAAAVLAILDAAEPLHPVHR